MNEHWLENLKTNLPIFLSKLKKDEYSYLPVLDGNTLAGKKLDLGFSCYALKIFIITTYWEELDIKNQENWINHIKSFKNNLIIFLVIPSLIIIILNFFLSNLFYKK